MCVYVSSSRCDGRYLLAFITQVSERDAQESCKRTPCMEGWKVGGGEKKNLPEYLLNIKINHRLRVSEVFDRPRANSGVTGDAGKRERPVRGRGKRGENSCDMSV